MAGSRRSSRLSSDVAATNGTAASPQPPAPAPAANQGRKRKAPGSDSAAAVAAAAAMPPPPAPSTPAKKARRTAAAAHPVPAPPVTPTPSAVRLIAEPAAPSPTKGRGRSRAAPAAGAAKGGKKTKAARAAEEEDDDDDREESPRLADPLGTNAPLLSPETSRVIAPRSRAAPPSTPTKAKTKAKANGLVAPGKPVTHHRHTTTAKILTEALNHLVAVDKRMKPLIEANPCHIFSAKGLAERIDPFEALASGIISQQVSGAAARAIKKRFVGLFRDGAAEGHDEDEEEPDLNAPHPRFPHPSQVAGCPLERLRTAGLSQRKAEYVAGLAEKFVAGDLSAQLLADAPYDELIEVLTSVRGLGRWSAEMFACFALKRLDVFSLGDLGVQRGMAAFVGRDVAKLKNKGGKWKYMSEQDMVEISDRFAPYRSVFMWYMWRVEATDVSTMEKSSG